MGATVWRIRSASSRLSLRWYGGDPLRLLVRALVGLIGLVALAAGVLWLVLPALIAPMSPPPVLPPLDPSALAGAVHPAAGGQESLQLTATALDGLLEARAGNGDLSAAWVVLRQGSADLHVDVVVPPAVPRLGGHTVGVEATLAPSVTADGLLSVAVRHVALGRLPLDTLVPVPTLLHWIAAHAGPPQSWWHVNGAVIVADPKTAPPIALGQIALRVTPSAIAVSPAFLVLTGTAQALVQLDGASLTAALSGALQAQGVPEVASIALQQGRAILSLFAPTGVVSTYALTPSVPQPGVLRVAVAGAGGAQAPGNVAALLVATAGPMPPWLATDAGGLTVDFNRMQPFQVAPGLQLRLLPESVQVDPALLHGWVGVEPAQSG